MLPLSTGTNNVFPWMVEATVAGTAAGLVAAGRVSLADVAQQAKVVRIEIEAEAPDLALIDAAHLVGDHIGSLLPFDPTRIRRIVLARALPDAVGLSPIGGLLEPCRSEDDFGVDVEVGPDCDHGRPLLAPISPGLYRAVHVHACRRLTLGDVVEVQGPGILAFDGDRERTLDDGQRVNLVVRRDGPWVIEPARALTAAARGGITLGGTDWQDSRDGASMGCC
jgi:hypothetical protein